MPQSIEQDFKSIWPRPRGHEIYNFGRSYLGYHTCKLTLCVLFLGEEKIFKEIMNFHNMTYMDTPKHKNLCPGGHKIYDFGRPFLDHHNYILSLFDPCQWVEKKTFKEIMHFHYMTYNYMVMPLHKNPCPGGHEIYNFGRQILGHYYYTLN